jgi:hypothetical protein
MYVSVKTYTHETAEDLVLAWKSPDHNRAKASPDPYQQPNIKIAVLRIRIHRIHMFLGHPDPLVRGMDPDPAADSSTKQK